MLDLVFFWVKSIYYSQDEEALKKFREVNQAYEVLSNLKTKKLYDKGSFYIVNFESYLATVAKTNILH